MEPTRLSYLPSELIQLLAEVTDYQQLQDLAQQVSEFSRFQDPNHPIWRYLYLRDISTYPLSKDRPRADFMGKTYRDAYIYGRGLLEHRQIYRLAIEGFDTALRPFFPSMDESTYKEILLAAATHGYLSIFRDSKEAGRYPDLATIYIALRIATTGGHLGVVRYLIETYNLTPDYMRYFIDSARTTNLELLEYYLAHLSLPLDDNTLYAAATNAGASGSLSMLQRVLDLATDRQLDQAYSRALSGAAAAQRNIHVINWLLAQGVVVDREHLRVAYNTPTYLRLLYSRDWTDDELVDLVDDLVRTLHRVVHVELETLLLRLQNNPAALVTILNNLEFGLRHPNSVAQIRSFIEPRL